MINESNIVCLNFFLKEEYVYKFALISKTSYLPFQNCKDYMPISYTFGLLDVEHGSPI